MPNASILSYAELDSLADWQAWVPFDEESLSHAPLEPGVYLARLGVTGPIVYVGMAGERKGKKRKGKGLRGRLHAYLTGKGLVSGLGEKCFDRALADASWLRQRLGEVEGNNYKCSKVWGKEAIMHADLHIRWATTDDKAAAERLERQCEELLTGLWNSPRRRGKANELEPA